MRVVDLHLTPDGGAFPGLDSALQSLEGIQRNELHNFEWHADGTYTILYRLTGEAVDTLQTMLESHDQVIRYDITTGPSSGLYTFVNVSEREGLSSLLAIVDDNALLLETPFQFTGGGLRVRVAGEEGALQNAFARATDQIDIDIEATGEYDPDRPVGIDQMTDRQYEALVAAHDLGYYETPRDVSFEEVAAELDCAPSTANELLRRAEAMLVSSVLSTQS